MFFEYGEERHSRRVARRIVEARRVEPIATTGRLAELVRRSIPGKWGPIDPATRVFQALRIAVNDELEHLDATLADLPDWLEPGGRAAIISFHSLEDRRVKTAFRDEPELTVLTRKPVTATAEEVAAQPPRAKRKIEGRRAMLRIPEPVRSGTSGRCRSRTTGTGGSRPAPRPTTTARPPPIGPVRGRSGPASSGRRRKPAPTRPSRSMPRPRPRPVRRPGSGSGAQLAVKPGHPTRTRRHSVIDVTPGSAPRESLFRRLRRRQPAGDSDPETTTGTTRTPEAPASKEAAPAQPRRGPIRGLKREARVGLVASCRS